MRVFCYNPNGYWGGLVQIEVDIRRGLPCIDIVGLAGGAVREARERVRAAINNSGFSFPLGHIMVSLSPADVPKSGAAFDLAIAIAILSAANPDAQPNALSILVMGELTLSGEIRRVEAIVPALLEAQQAGIDQCVIPTANQSESSLIAGMTGIVTAKLGEAWQGLCKLQARVNAGDTEIQVSGRHGSAWAKPVGENQFDIRIFRDKPLLLLALLAAAAGRHHILAYGPPGAGKTMALRFLGSILPDLNEAERLEVNRIHSLSGCLAERGILVDRPPVRMPHHASSAESLLGGGKLGRPGELSLAHRGLLILDEAAEFKKNLLQSLREPMEDGQVRLGRVGGLVRHPAGFILGMSLNPCPCGKYGSGHDACSCSALEVQHYWARIGAPVIDRIDIRYRFGQKMESQAGFGSGIDDWRELGFLQSLESIEDFRKLIATAASRVEIPNGYLRGLELEQSCRLDGEATQLLNRQIQDKGILARARHGILRLARTVADLQGEAIINRQACSAAMALRAAIAPVDGICLFS